jgi:hypothetical protein
LPDYDWGPSSGPRSSPLAPADQVDGVHEEERLSIAQTDLESDGLHHSQQYYISPQESGGITETSEIVIASTATQNTTALFECAECSATFSKLGDFNKHMKKHTRPFQCDD